MKFCYTFPGQGSQSLNMLDKLMQIDTIKDQVELLFSSAKKNTGIDYLAMTRDKDRTRIDQTINTQPLMLISSYAIYQAWQDFNGRAKAYVVAGHSLGEFTALIAAGVLEFADALYLVTKRASYMQSAANSQVGAMAAILGIEDDTIIKICNEISQETKQVVAGVNFNAPGQVVIAGDKLSVDVAIQSFKSIGAKAVLLNVSVAAHTILMQEAAHRLSQDFDNVRWSLPNIQVMQNYSAKIYTGLDEIKQALIKQIYSPVLWRKSIENIVDLGVDTFIETGPGGVLTGLNKRINKDIYSYNLHNHDNWTEIKQRLY